MFQGFLSPLHPPMSLSMREYVRVVGLVIRDLAYDGSDQLLGRHSTNLASDGQKGTRGEIGGQQQAQRRTGQTQNEDETIRGGGRGGIQAFTDPPTGHGQGHHAQQTE
jgi:hypothetical protein